jgi:hypothetical protein
MRRKDFSIGLVVASCDVPSWQHFAIDQLVSLASVDLSYLLVGHHKHASIEEESKLLYRLCRRELKNGASDSALKKKNLLDIIPESKCIEIPKSRDQVNLGDLIPSSVTNKDDLPNLIIAFDCLTWVPFLSGFAKEGIWYFVHDCGQTAVTDGSTVGVWQVLQRQPFIYSALVERKPGCEKDVVVYESHSGVRKRSFTDSRNEHLWKIGNFPSRSLDRKRLGNEAQKSFAVDSSICAFESLERVPKKWSVDDRNLIFPFLRHYLWLLWRMFARRVSRERWVLMLGSEKFTGKFEKLSKILPPKGRFWADPFIVSHRDDTYIFFEDACQSSWCGHLSVLKIDKNGGHSPPHEILVKPYHLSYPFVFSWRNEMYLVPESAENGTVGIYRAVDFPYKWQFVCNLMEGVFVYDATLFEHDGRWWMFAACKSHRDASSWDELYIYYADSPVSTNWYPHSMNPVVSDVRSARPAGRIFREHGKIYRPSQNNSYFYGYGLNINEVLELSVSVYRERTVDSWYPAPRDSVKGIHTINRAKNLVVIDAIMGS